MVDDKTSGKWSDLMNKLSSIEDLQNLTQLDILNLKNEIEKIKLVSETVVPPEIQTKIVELEKIARNVDILKKWKQTVEEVKFLRSKVIGAPLPPQGAEAPSRPAGASKTDVENLRNEIGIIRKKLGAKELAAAPFDVSGLTNAIQENRKTIESLKRMLTEKSAPQPQITNIEEMKNMIKENRRIVEDLRSKAHGSFSTIPAETHGELETLHSEISKLESEVKGIKSEKTEAGPEGRGEITTLRKELFTKLEDLNTKFSSGGVGASEELKQAMEANRESIENLRSLISEEGTSGLKKEIESNRKFMQELRQMVLSKKPGSKVMLPPDPEMRKKMLSVEQKVSSLARKLEKMNNLKPIKLPEIESPKPLKVSSSKDLEGLKSQIDSILSKMNGFATKEDVKKGVIEKQMKTDEKLVKGDIYKEMEDIKKAIIRNEDHINNMVSDVEGIKKEVGTVEKREWGKVSDIPDLEDLKRRIDEIEKRLKTTQTGMLMIE